MYKCYVCKEQKEREHFNKDSSRPSGLMSKCKDCSKLRAKLKRKTDEGKAKRVVQARKWKRNNRPKERAHKAVARALKSGVLVRPIHCSKCGSDQYIQGHHDDYNLPLVVRWLCRECHLNHHKELWENATR